MVPHCQCYHTAAWLWPYILLSVLLLHQQIMQSVGVTWNWNGPGHSQRDRSKTVQKVEKKEKADIMPSR